MQSQAQTEGPSSRGTRMRKALLTTLRISPWLVFGPITGLMTEAAALSFRKGRPGLGLFYLGLNLAVLLAIPLATALIARRI